MNILLVSQCDKRALVETRRIIDQFAERRGDRTWQTPITQAGLDTLRKLLRKTARKNTAVACHWIRGLDHSELLWVVGDARRFNAEGAVPTNTTERNVLRREDENDWHSAEDIRLLAQLAALLHDLGKASIAFQERLQGKRTERNLIRHEWVSLRLFLAFVGDDDDIGWLTRLADASAVDAATWTTAERYMRDGQDSGIDPHPFRGLTERAPMAAAIGWLIVSHHRLPVAPAWKDDGTQAWIGAKAIGFEHAWLERPLANVAHNWNEIKETLDSAAFDPYWRMAAQLPVGDPAWWKHASRVAGRLLQLRERRRDDWLDNAYVMHLARLCLMLADHHYSSLGVDREGRPVQARLSFLQDGQTLFANTGKDALGRTLPKQSLLEHLLGVGHDAGLIAHALPGFERHLPRLANHRGLRKRSADSRFSWQDKAYDAAVAIRNAAREHGAFVVNMASTGCGKTLANARILYALADPQRGLRASYALGLRTLTLQTGRSYRRDLHLNDDELAVLVGGSANRALFAFHERQAESSGSASQQSLLEEDSHVLYEGVMADHPLLSRALANPDIRKLLSAPMLVCTVDHLAPATESLRAGRQIAPLLRLMSSDLVLDELDDYDLDDLPALTRLVHFAGMLGTRVILSSATLPPALVEGMFRAYQAGRRLHRRNRGVDGGRDDAAIEVPCLWIDEFGVPLVRECADAAIFAESHAQFVERRCVRLEAEPALRIVRLWPLPMASGQKREAVRAAFAGQVRAASLQLHAAHADVDSETGTRVSLGIVRMAHVDRIIDVARELHRLGGQEGLRIHVCVYHARFPLAQRSSIEGMLDAAFDRRKPETLWRQPSIRAAIDAAPHDEHMFVVLASPVCEVGRDWCADWAVAEPSSMRSLIQLAGRVQRHRRKPPSSPNLVVFDTNLKALEDPDPGKPAFRRPGFEDGDRFLLATHRLGTLWPGADDQRIDALPRIRPRPTAEREPNRNWIDLEHARMEAAMQPVAVSASTAAPAPASTSGRSRSRPGAPTWRWQRDLAAPGWQFPQATLLGVLAQQQAFREDTLPDRTLLFLPDDDEEALILHRVEDSLEKAGKDPHVQATHYPIPFEPSPGVEPWAAMDLAQLLERVRELAEAENLPLREAARKFTAVEVPDSKETLAWNWHSWFGFTSRR
ncbi:type I-F CRISPR-associated helicase Cas3f [Dokdonella sp. MW10]|uniref:type I-F CRISPR-associated helicase Cas3f n=1 Tax=Dokdonella sp. MW10 TaxID=2992926 RepID=UPI003F7D55FD